MYTVFTIAVTVAFFCLYSSIHYLIIIPQNNSIDQKTISCFILFRLLLFCAKTKTKTNKNRLGNQVGYQIRMESKRSKNTKLLFCTTGVILRRLQDDHELKSITHVIVDEVHERQVQTDVLLIALRQLLRTTRRDLKVILVRSLC